MPLQLAAIQAALRDAGLDGWLLYDFHGSNPIAARIAQTDGVGLTTRRWFYLVPAQGEPRGLVHAIERHNLDHLPGAKLVYAGRRALEDGLRTLTAGLRRVAMEYSPGGAIPYVSRVDAGTVEMVRNLGLEVVTSGDLIQQFEAVWDAPALRSHQQASERLYRIKDKAFHEIGRLVRTAGRTTEYDIQQRMVEWFGEEGLISDSPPVVAAEENAGNPHYLPTAAKHRTIGADELVLLDLWGKLDGAGTVFADITWVGFTGSDVPHEITRAFETIVRARDTAIELVLTAAGERRDLRGWQVDRAARRVLEEAGFTPNILHRTGHSLGTSVHGDGVHMDDYETYDDRRLLPGTGFTIEPGLYFEHFGVRTEINMYFGDGKATVTGPVQNAIVTLAEPIDTRSFRSLEG